MTPPNFNLLAVWFLIFSTVPKYVTAKSPPNCLPSGSGSEDIINRLFRNGGSKTIVNLCPLSVHHINEPIVFTSHEQTLTTLGNPRDWTRAMLIVKGTNQAMAIKADCRQCNGAVVKSLVIDGNRPELLRIKNGGALVEMGNAEGQVVRDCKVLEPRGWSAVHYREGDERQCRGGLIKDNEIGPAGEEWDDEYDGPEKDGSRWGNPRADGISLACMDSVVDGNTVYDATDGAIVIFGSPGSEVKNNRVISRTRMIMGGINLVDIDPWDGDYTRTRVHHNTISAFGAYIKGGINVGMACWTDDTESIVHSGSVTENTIEGNHIGYGITVASAKDFVVMKNKSTAKFSGFKGRTCPQAPQNANPGPFIINRGSSEGKFQSDFVNGEVQHSICIEPLLDTGSSYKPWRMRDGAEATALQASKQLSAEIANIGGPVDPDVADHIVAYQLELMNAMQTLSSKIGEQPKKGVPEKAAGRKGLRRGREARNTGPSVTGSPFSAALADLSTRLANLEVERKQLRSMFETMQSELSLHNSKFWKWKTYQGNSLDSLLHSARNFISTPMVIDSSSDTQPLLSAPPRRNSWRPAGLILSLEMVLLVLVMVVQRLGQASNVKRRSSSVFTGTPATTAGNGLLLERIADRFDTREIPLAGSASGSSGLGRENSIGRNRRKGQSASGPGLDFANYN